jgi:hypothetical protein
MGAPTNSAERSLMSGALLWRQRAVLLERLLNLHLYEPHGSSAMGDTQMLLEANRQELRRLGEMP